MTEFIASHSAVDDKYNHEQKRRSKAKSIVAHNGGGIEFNRDAQLLFATASNGLSIKRYYTNVLNDLKNGKLTWQHLNLIMINLKMRRI